MSPAADNAAGGAAGGAARRALADILDAPPKGVWLREEGSVLRIGASMRSIPRFMIFGSLAFLLVFPFVGLIMGFALISTKVPWYLIPILMLLPALPMLLMGVHAVRMLMGRVEIVIDGRDAYAVDGWPLARKRRFDPAAVVQVRLEPKGRGGDEEVVIEADREIRLGHYLKPPRQQYLIAALGPILVHANTESPLASIDTSRPPRGAWLREDGGVLRVGATSRRWALGLFCAAYGTLAVMAIIKNGNALAWTMAPPLLGTAAVSLIGRRWEVTVDGPSGEATKGFGPFVMAAAFEPDRVFDVAVHGRHVMIGWDDRSLALGDGLTYACRRFMAAVLWQRFSPMPPPPEGEPDASLDEGVA